MMESFKLIYITTSHFWRGEAEAIISLMEKESFIPHLRKPEAQESDIKALLDAIPPVYYSRIVLHSCFNLCADYGLRGIHLNSRANVVPEKFKGTVSRSCHSLAELERCNQEGYDYLTLSPIFDSISKIGYHSAFTPEMIADAANRGIINRRTIALGGVTRHVLSLLQSMGFGGAAMLGEIWKPWNTQSF